ncbi:MAG: cyanophycinase [Candidatus Coatesbacteria bacterium]|nr:cyanophycinase [Candidatus Coatesbacteria bacterium]
MNKGTLFIIGGGEDTSKDKIVLNELVSEAGGTKAKIGVITTATEHERDVIGKYRSAFSQIGVAEIYHFDIRRAEDADEDRYSAALASLDAVLFSGGSQLRLTTILGGTSFIKKLEQRFSEGIIIAGTSAGAACLSNPMIHEGASEDSFYYGDVKVSPGFGFISNSVIDTHFEARARIGRLLQVVAINNSLLGIGIGEDTALVIASENIARVVGTSIVMIVDGANIINTNVDQIDYGEPISLSNARIDVIAPGQSYDLNEKQFTRESKKKGNKFLFF